MDKKFKNYLNEGSVPIRFMNYESDLKRFKETIRDIQKDLISLVARSDNPNEIKWKLRYIRLFNDFDIVDIKMSSIIVVLRELRKKYEKF